MEEVAMRLNRGAVVLLGLLAIFMCGGLFAQELTTGILEGVVKDEHGKPIAAAVISISGPQGVRTAVTDGKGRFSFRSLPVGSYIVKTEASGFATTVETQGEGTAH